ncbi:MAG: hypothetical protein NTW25_08710 [Candidatus Kapabacteria bacterium]|nr:hypothetical protein [Candidatus Kapabacteria bacterium]
MKKFFVVFVMVLFCSSLTYSQNVLDTLWQIRSGASPEIGRFIGFVQNPIDSNIVVSISNDDNINPVSYIAQIDSKKGNIKKEDIVPTTYLNLWYLNDSNNFLVQTSHLEIISKNSYERVLLDSIEAYDVFYNKSLDKAISSWKSSIKIYDTKEKNIIKEYNESNYFHRANVQVYKSVISNYNKYLIYNSSTQLSPNPPYPNISELVVLDSNGKVVYIDKNDLNLSYGTPERILAISNDQKLIAYMTSENKSTIKILDLTTLKVVKSVSILNLRPLLLRFSPDDKLLFLGSESGLSYFDLENWKRKLITDDGVIDNFNFDLFNPNIIYINLGGLFQAFKINYTTSVNNENPVANLFIANYQANTHSLNLNMNLVNNGNLMVTLYNISGSPSMTVENSLFQLGESSKNYDMSILLNGSYYLQIKINNEIIYPALNFIKVN